MLNYRYGRRSFFFAPDNGESGGSGPSGPTGATGDVIVTPFDNLDLSEFDEETRNTLTKAKDEFVATVQQTKKQAAEIAHVTGLAKRFQSDSDRLKAEINKTKKTEEKPDDPFLEIAKQELRAAKYPENEVEHLAPVFAGISRRSAEALRKQLGTDLAPMAGSVLANEATQAFQLATQTDRIGFMQVPAVAQKVWELVEKRIADGQPTNDAIVSNLGKMVYVDHLAEEAAAGRTVTLPRVAAAPNMTTRPNGFSYPGFSTNAIIPTLPSTVDPNAPRTRLNEDTQMALATTFKHIERETGVKTKAFGTPAKK